MQIPMASGTANMFYWWLAARGLAERGVGLISESIHAPYAVPTQSPAVDSRKAVVEVCARKSVPRAGQEALHICRADW